MTRHMSGAAVLGDAPPADTSSEVSHRRMMSSAGVMGASHLGAQACAYGSLIFLARIVSPSDFGTIAIGTTVVYAAALVVSHGTLGGIVVRPRLSRRHLIGAVMGCLLISVVLAGLMAGLAGPFVRLFASGGDPHAFAALALCLPLYAIALVPTALLQRSMAFGRLAGINAFANVTSALAAVAVGLEGLGVWALVVRLLGTFALQALLTNLCCRSALREALTSPRAPGDFSAARGGDRWFFLFAVAYMLTMNQDNLVIGQSTDAHVVGLYALAFTIAMSPCTQFAEQVGKVLLAAAAAAPEESRGQAEHSVALMSALLMPLLPAGIVLAPVVLPAVLGPHWTPAVPVFQVLLIAAVGMAIVNCLGESLAGAGHMAFRAKIMVVRCVATFIGLVALVHIAGLTGAALAHLIVFVPCAVLYCSIGARLVGTSAGALWHRVRPALAALAIQISVTGAVALVLWGCGAPGVLTHTIAAVAGLATVLPWVIRSVIPLVRP
jgi:O-antigen/teichoic acid export membrane protein